MPASLTREDVISYFKAYGIRVDCTLAHSKTQAQGWIGELKIYCPSKYSKESLTNTCHLIKGCLFELADPYNLKIEKDRPYVLEPAFSEILSFSSSNSQLKLGDLKVYFTKLSLENGYDLKLFFRQQHCASNNEQSLFEVHVSNKQDAISLASLTHTCGRTVFCLNIAKKPRKEPAQAPPQQHLNQVYLQTGVDGIKTLQGPITRQSSVGGFNADAPRLSQHPSESQNETFSNDTSQLSSLRSQFGHAEIINFAHKAKVENERPTTSANEPSFERTQKSKFLPQDTVPIQSHRPSQNYSQYSEQQFSDFQRIQTQPLSLATKEFQGLNRKSSLNNQPYPLGGDAENPTSSARRTNAQHPSTVLESNEFLGPNVAQGPDGHKGQNGPVDSSLSSHRRALNTVVSSEETFNGVPQAFKAVRPEIMPSEAIISHGRNPLNDQNLLQYSGFNSNRQVASGLRARDFQNSGLYQESQYPQNKSPAYQKRLEEQVSGKCLLDGGQISNGTYKDNRMALQVVMRAESGSSNQTHLSPFFSNKPVSSNSQINQAKGSTTIEITQDKNDGCSSGLDCSNLRAKPLRVPAAVDQMAAVISTRLQRQALALRNKPYAMFQRNKLEHNTGDFVQFANLKDLHPIGKFIAERNERSETGFTENVIVKGATQFVCLEYGLRDFGGNFIPKEYNLWQGVSNKAEEILIGSISRARLQMSDEFSTLESKLCTFWQAQEDVSDTQKKARQLRESVQSLNLVRASRDNSEHTSKRTSTDKYTASDESINNGQDSASLLAGASLETNRFPASAQICGVRSSCIQRSSLTAQS